MAETYFNPAFIPVLETERLKLRGITLADVPDSAGMWMDPAVTEFISGTPATIEDVWGRVYRKIGHWALLGYGGWVVRERFSGAFVGEIGFLSAHRDIAPPLDDATPELGWALSPAAQGRGFATEAVRAALVWGTSYFRHPRSLCIIDPENVKSLRVAEKCGYREVRRALYKDYPTIILERG